MARECEVVGIETARALGAPASSPALHNELWELDGNVIADERDVTITVDAFSYRLNTRSFFQVNRHLLGTMLRLVANHASKVKNKHTAVDLYAGVGFFTVPIASLFDRVTMIEGSPVSARYARMNVPRNVKVIAASVEEKMHTFPEVDFTFLDPPRAGTRKDVTERVGARTKESIAYLSCDPVTFARDASRLIASGWRLAALDLPDLFPNTHHVETLSSFERA
jgi:23S rRNA (uracil1939-C5)-methyltransferase